MATSPIPFERARHREYRNKELGVAMAEPVDLKRFPFGADRVRGTGEGSIA
jgi:hypothetical protein